MIAQWHFLTVSSSIEMEAKNFEVVFIQHVRKLFGAAGGATPSEPVALSVAHAGVGNGDLRAQSSDVAESGKLEVIGGVGF